MLANLLSGRPVSLSMHDSQRHSSDPCHGYAQAQAAQCHIAMVSGISKPASVCTANPHPSHSTCPVQADCVWAFCSNAAAARAWVRSSMSAASGRPAADETAGAGAAVLDTDAAACALWHCTACCHAACGCPACALRSGLPCQLLCSIHSRPAARLASCILCQAISSRSAASAAVAACAVLLPPHGGHSHQCPAAAPSAAAGKWHQGACQLTDCH